MKLLALFFAKNNSFHLAIEAVLQIYLLQEHQKLECDLQTTPCQVLESEIGRWTTLFPGQTGPQTSVLMELSGCGIDQKSQLRTMMNTVRNTRTSWQRQKIISILAKIGI